MNRLTWLFLAGVMILVSCAPASNPAPTALAPTAAPPTLTPVPEATEAPTLVPISLAGPQAGTTMDWVDGSQLAYVPAGDLLIFKFV